MVAELITAALAATATTLVPRQGPPPPQPTNCPLTINCPANNGCLSTAANGAVFQVKCTTNYNGQVLAVTQAPSMTNCMTACSLTTGCKGLNYKDKFCYLLDSSLGASQSVSDVEAATQSRSATKPTSGPASPNCPNGPVCPRGDDCSYQLGSKYFIARCNFDFYGGDMPQGVSKQATLKACVDKCAATPSCVGVSYAADSTCYMKSDLKPGVYSEDVDGVYLK